MAARSFSTNESCGTLRSAYISLTDCNIKYHNRDVSKHLKYDVHRRKFHQLEFGREWTSDNYKFHWNMDADGKMLSITLPDNGKSWVEYYFTVSGYDSDLVIGYQKKNDSSEIYAVRGSPDHEKIA